MKPTVYQNKKVYFRLDVSDEESRTFRLSLVDGLDYFSTSIGTLVRYVWDHVHRKQLFLAHLFGIYMNYEFCSAINFVVTCLLEAVHAHVMHSVDSGEPGIPGRQRQR